MNTNTHPAAAVPPVLEPEVVLDRFLQWQLDARHYPGALVHVERAGEVLARRCVGLLDPVAGTPMREDALFRIASMTKPIVSVVALMLAHEGRLNLDAALPGLLPELAALRMVDGRAPARPATVRDLLRHTAGFGYPGEVKDKRARDALIASRLDSDLPLLDGTALLQRLAGLPLAVEPGSAFTYGYATDVLGVLIERITDRRLGESLRERVFEPLGMTQTTFEVSDRSRLAQGLPEDRGWRGFEDKYIEAQAAGTPLHSGGGGLASTIDDYARFARMLADGGRFDGGALLPPESIAQMFSDQLDPLIPGPQGYTGPGFGFGLGLAVRQGWGAGAVPSRSGELTWFGICGTVIWLQPRERWFALQMSVNMPSRMLSRMEFRRSVDPLLRRKSA